MRLVDMCHSNLGLRVIKKQEKKVPHVLAITDASKPRHFADVWQAKHAADDRTVVKRPNN